MSIYRTHTCGELRKSEVGKSVRLSGWIHSVRDHGGVIFIDLRDHYGITQVVIDPECAFYQSLDRWRVETVVRFDGKVVARSTETVNPKLATGEIEVQATDMEILGEAEVLPFLVAKDDQAPEALRLKYRFLDLRREELHRNIILRSQVIAEIRRHSPDIILLQEVDECSRRTYRINEVEMLRRAFPDYHIYLAYNYKSFFVPIPIKAPMGRVASGVVLMSRIEPEEVHRWQYPSRFPWPVSMFNLKRCLLTATFRLADGSRLVIGNTHNTAYDTGGMRTAEIRWLGGLTARLASEGTPFIIGGDWNQYPPEYIPGPAETSNPHFTTVALDTALLRGTGRVVWDPSARTLRHLNIPYGPESVLTVTDYFYISPDVRTSTVRTIDLSYKHSDHQPVLLRCQL